MSLPQVSIVIPAYKPAHFEQCLRSAIGQTYPNIDISVSDNCPTDEIRAICERFPMVVYQRNVAIREQNVLSATYGAKGHYVKPLFDDDLLHPFCVERMVQAAEANPEIGLVFSASTVIDIDNRRLQQRRPFEGTGKLSGRELHRIVTIGMVNPVGEFSSILIRRATLWSIPPARLFWFGDHDCSLGLADAVAYCNLAAAGGAMYLDEELTYFRRDPRLMSNSNAASNSNIGYCYSDGMDMIIQVHKMGMIDTAELLATEEAVSKSAERDGNFSQVRDAYVRYTDYVRRVRG
jgi:glycosyltransferase involved in cell wall biosynthesis